MTIMHDGASERPSAADLLTAVSRAYDAVVDLSTEVRAEDQSQAEIDAALSTFQLRHRRVVELAYAMDRP